MTISLPEPPPLRVQLRGERPSHGRQQGAVGVARRRPRQGTVLAGRARWLAARRRLPRRRPHRLQRSRQESRPVFTPGTNPRCAPRHHPRWTNQSAGTQAAIGSDSLRIRRRTARYWST